MAVINDRYPVRAVIAADLLPLRQSCWQRLSQAQAQQRLKLIQRAHTKQRGLGAVVQASASQDIIAYGQIMRLHHCAEISNLFVVASYRGQGIGTALIRYLIAQCPMGCRWIEIGVAHDNHAAYALYRRLGFAPSYQRLLPMATGTALIHYLRFAVPD